MGDILLYLFNVRLNSYFTILKQCSAIEKAYSIEFIIFPHFR